MVGGFVFSSPWAGCATGLFSGGRAAGTVLVATGFGVGLGGVFGTFAVLAATRTLVGGVFGVPSWLPALMGLAGPFRITGLLGCAGFALDPGAAGGFPARAGPLDLILALATAFDEVDPFDLDFVLPAVPLAFTTGMDFFFAPADFTLAPIPFSLLLEEAFTLVPDATAFFFLAGGAGRFTGFALAMVRSGKLDARQSKNIRLSCKSARNAVKGTGVHGSCGVR